MTIIELAQRFNKVIQAVQTVAQKTLDTNSLSEEEKKYLVYIYPRHEIDKDYKENDRVEQYGKLFKCKKAHKGSYETLPQIDKVFWEEINIDGSAVVEKKELPFYNSDTSYSLNDEVQYFRKNYKYIGKTKEAGKIPGVDTDFWKEI